MVARSARPERAVPTVIMGDLRASVLPDGPPADATKFAISTDRGGRSYAEPSWAAESGRPRLTDVLLGTARLALRSADRSCRRA